MLFSPSCPGMDSGMSSPLAVSDPASVIPGILALLCTSCGNHQEKAHLELKKIPQVPGHWCSAPKISPWVPQ